MNVTCDKCQKRYSIADDKVKGRTVKVKCRHCGHVILVSSAGAPKEQTPWEDERTTAMPELNRSSVWFAMIKGKQEGPFDVRGLETRIAAGEVSLRTYLWREGMADWKRAGDVPELSRLFATAGTAPRPPPAPAPSAPQPPPVEKALPRAAAAASTRTRTGAMRVATPIAESSTDPETPKPAATQKALARTGARPRVTDVATGVEQPILPTAPKGKAGNAADPLGELFSDASLPEPTAHSPDATLREEDAPRKEEAPADPFLALGDLDPSKVPPTTESTKFFIAQAGVNRRNPPWKIGLFIGGAIGLPLLVFVLLTQFKPDVLTVKAVDESGQEVSQSVFTAGGMGGLRDMLTGKNKKKDNREGRAPRSVAKKDEVAAVPEPVKAERYLPRETPSPVDTKQLADLYTDNSKIDRGPRVRKDAVVEQTDTSSGGLSQDAVQKVVNQSLQAFNSCVEAELRKNPNFQGGKVNIVATVAASGVVSRVTIDRREIDASDVGNCIKLRARKMTFAEFKGDEETEIRFPLFLTVGQSL